MAILLAGVVAVNVAVLRLNVTLDDLGRERVRLIADNARLESEISTSVASVRIQSEARSRLGLRPASELTFVDLRASR